MTTIIPDTDTSEGKKLAEYQPGDTVQLTATIEENNDGELGATVSKCEKVEAEEGAEPESEGDEGEPAAPAPAVKSQQSILKNAGRRIGGSTY